MAGYSQRYNKPLGDGRIGPNPDALERTGPVVPVQVGIPAALARQFESAGDAIPEPAVGYALVDTGANISAVDEPILTRLGVSPVGRLSVVTAHGIAEGKLEYPGRFLFPGTTLQPREFARLLGIDLRGYRSQQGPTIIALLGRDVLRDYVLVYDGPGAYFTLTG
ncbi:MAG: hypothetical protein ACOYXU_06200 [Nitrospirota bacterium]